MISRSLTRAFGVTLLGLLPISGACGSDAETASEVERGRALFADPSLSTSTSNVFSCATCHVADARGDDSIVAGAALGGVTERPTFWGGRELELLGAINQCRTWFLDTPIPWDGTEPEARALYTYLASLPKSEPASVPFTVPPVAREPVGPGDPLSGGEVYRRACALCHGPIHTGKDRLAPLAPKLPDQTLSEHAASYTKEEQRLVFVEKIRHGPFFQYGGSMPPFSVERVSEAELSNLLAYLGLPP
jgi:mono/diheme cytochrome c family protein